MNRLPADRLLHNFRAERRPALVAPSRWADGRLRARAGDAQRRSELRGHFTGHYLSASAQLYASTGDKEVKAKGDEMVAELAKCQAEAGPADTSARSPLECFDRLGRAQAASWAPFYTIHKIMAGMFDMYQLAGNQQALEVLAGHGATGPTSGPRPKSEEHMQDILNTEYGGMNEVLYNLAAATGDDRWAKAGDRFTKKRFFNPLACAATSCAACTSTRTSRR